MLLNIDKECLIWNRLKDLLEHIRFADLEIKSLMTLKDRLGARALAITSNISERVSGSKDIDGVYSIVDGYVDLEKSYN